MSSDRTTKVEYLTLDEIRLDGGTQPRETMDWRHVKLLEGQIEEGHQLEPVVVFCDGEFYWLADGFHRWYAHYSQKEEAISCTVYTGTQRDAILYSVGANEGNKPALPRSRKDKRRAVLTLLRDSEWNQWSDREIARRCKVDHATVSKVRASLTGEIPSNTSEQFLTGEIPSNTSEQSFTGDFAGEKRTYRTRHGTIAKMNTSNIGKPRNTARSQLGVSPGCSVTVKDTHALFPNQSGVVVQLPSPDSAIVEFTDGKRELVYIKDLDMKQPSDSANSLQLAHHLKLVDGGLVEISAPNNSKIHARLGRIANVTDCTVQIWVRDVESMTMLLHTLKHQQVEPVPMEQEPQLALVRSRIDRLKKCNLDPYEVEMINLLERPVAFTPVELEYLASIEKRHQL